MAMAPRRSALYSRGSPRLTIAPRRDRRQPGMRWLPVRHGPLIDHRASPISPRPARPGMRWLPSGVASPSPRARGLPCGAGRRRPGCRYLQEVERALHGGVAGGGGGAGRWPRGGIWRSDVGIGCEFWNGKEKGERERTGKWGRCGRTGNQRTNPYLTASV
jgi:hypothetical protein